MSGTKLLKDKFKDAPTVTSLESTDRIVAVDGNGELKRITQERVSNPLSEVLVLSPQWIRIGEFSNNAYALLSISTTWNAVSGIHLLVDMILHTHNVAYNQVAVLSRLRHSPTTVVSKIRVLIKRDSTSYVDVYYNANGNSTLISKLISGRAFAMYATPILNAQIPEGYVAREFSLATVSESAEIVGGG